MKRILFFVLCLAGTNILFARKDFKNAADVQQVSHHSSSITHNHTDTALISLPDLQEALPVDGTLIVQTPPIRMTEETIIIPVVVHVLYNAMQQNISDEQIMSQITALNKDYRGTNADRSKAPWYFAALAADCGIGFRLATKSPDGNATSGIIRKHTNITMFGADDRIKSSANGGDDGWDRRHYLNLWVGNLAGGMLGYSSIPGAQADKDGVVIQYTAFGTMGTASAPFNLGRTATHEIGHWLNLKHLWGDAYCGDDEVDDTPTQRSSNRGSPSGEKFSCGTTDHGDMYMDFMDLTDDAAMFMFTDGQKRRMRSLFQSYGLRHEMISTDINSRTTLPLLFALPVQSEIREYDIAVSPNPATSVMNIENKTNTILINQPVTIYNCTGQPVMMQNINGSRMTIDVSRLHPGLYFIKVGVDKGSPVKKFIKE